MGAFILHSFPSLFLLNNWKYKQKYKNLTWQETVPLIYI